MKGDRQPGQLLVEMIIGKLNRRFRGFTRLKADQASVPSPIFMLKFSVRWVSANGLPSFKPS